MWLHTHALLIFALPQSRFISEKIVATALKTRLSFKEKAEGLITCPKRENAAGGLRDVYFYSISFSSYKIKFSIITKFK